MVDNRNQRFEHVGKSLIFVSSRNHPRAPTTSRRCAQTNETRKLTLFLQLQIHMLDICPRRRFHDGGGVSGNLRRPPLSPGKRHQHPVGFLRAQERRHLPTAGRIARWRCTVTHKKHKMGGKKTYIFF